MSAAPALQLERTMKVCSGRAAVLDAPRNVSFGSVEFGPPGPGQVLIRLQGCGVCGSNVPVWEGRPWFEYPREPGSPGHEGWGIVEAAGSGVSHVKPGDRVAALSYHAFATHDIADAGQVVRLPASIDDLPFPGEAVGCAMNVLHRCRLRPNETVAVVGIGFLGALLVQLAAAAGARVLALSRREFSLAIARECGADRAIAMSDPHALESVHEFAGADGCDCVIEATGYQQPLDLASKLVATRGRLVIAGYHQDGLRTVDLQSWNWRGIDVINAHERDPQLYVRGMEEAATEVAAGRLRLAELMTHSYPLSELNDALRVASERPDGFLKSWVRCI